MTITAKNSSAGCTSTWNDDPPINDVILTEMTESFTDNANLEDEVTVTLNLGSEGGGSSTGSLEVTATDDLDTAVSVNADSVISMYFQFDTQDTVHGTHMSGGLGNENYAIYFTQPSIVLHK